jgi:hypothetical protein
MDCVRIKGIAMTRFWLKITPWTLTWLAGIAANVTAAAITAHLIYRSPEIRTPPDGACTPPLLRAERERRGPPRWGSPAKPPDDQQFMHLGYSVRPARPTPSFVLFGGTAPRKDEDAV